MQIRGLHHLTLISGGPRSDDRVLPRPARAGDRARRAVRRRSEHAPRVVRGARRRARACCSASCTTPTCPRASSATGSTHHFALIVDSADEHAAWRDYLRRQGVECTDVFDRGAFRLDLPARSRRAHRRDRHRAGRASPAPAARPLNDRAAGAFEASSSASAPHASSETAVDRIARQHAREGVALAIGHRADGLRLRHGDRREEPAAASTPPAMLTHQQVADRHALGLPRARRARRRRPTSRPRLPAA